MTRSRTPAIDGLRGLAALSVVLFHAWLYTRPHVVAVGRDGLADDAWHELRIGLVLFFVLSGFLLYRPWAAAAIDGRAAPRVGAYLRHRAARVVPAYYLAIAGSVLLLWGSGDAPGVRLPPAEGLWRFFAFTQNFDVSTVMTLDPPMWTLAIEVCFYALLPLVGWAALRAGRRRSVQAALVLVLLAEGLAWNWWIAGRGFDLPFSKNLLAMLPYFAAGMLAAVLGHGREPGRRGRSLMLLAGAAAVLANAAWQSHAAHADPTAMAPRVLRDLIAAAGFAAIVAVASARGAQRGLLARRELAWLGTVSYGLYLWHVPVLLALRAEGMLPLSPLGAVAVALPASLLLATASWRLVERPAIAWARSRRGAPAPAGRHPLAPARTIALGALLAGVLLALAG